MKKVLLITVAALAFLTFGCEKKGEYKPGTYLGTSEYTSSGSKFVTTATLYVANNGKIEMVYIDSTYNKNGVNTTKKTLGDDYEMKQTSANIGVIEGGAEWYEQVAVIEKKVIAEQNLDWVKWSDNEKTKLDGVTGCTISANDYIKAVENALKQAK